MAYLGYAILAQNCVPINWLTRLHCFIFLLRNIEKRLQTECIALCASASKTVEEELDGTSKDAVGPAPNGSRRRGAVGQPRERIVGQDEAIRQIVDVYQT